MKPLPVAGVATLARLAAAEPDSLRPELKAACPNPPRRVNRLIELALIGAHRCVRGLPLHADTPIYMAFTTGCMADSADLVHDVVHARPVMPVTFINVSSNMAGFYVAASLGLHSGNQVVACNDFAWEAALELAMLGATGTRGLLLGAVEECAWPLPEHRERLGLPPNAPLLESSHWLLADREAAAPIAQVRGIWRLAGDAALADWLKTPQWPENARVRLQGFADADALQRRLGLVAWQGGETDGYSGMPAAAACCAFIERERGALLHLSRGVAGSMYAVLIESRGAAAT